MRTFWFWSPHLVISGVGWLVSAEGLKPLGGRAVFALFTGRGCWGCGAPVARAGKTRSIRVESVRHWPAGQTAPVSTEEPGPSVPMKPRRKHAEEVSPGLSVQSPEEVRDWSVTGPDASDVLLADARA